MPGTTRSVVIVGSGFAGFGCARRLARSVRRKKIADVEITLVSPDDYMLYTPLLPDVVGGTADSRSAMVPLSGMLPGVRLVRGHVENVDLDGRTLTYVDLDRRPREMHWDRVVLTPGSVSRFFDIPGLADHARGFKTTADALYLRDHVVEQLELGNREPDPRKARAHRTVVVVGASYTGTALVASLRAVADAAADQAGFDPGDVRILLLDLSTQVMPEVGPRLSATAMHVLTDHGIDVRLGCTLADVHPDHVVLSDGSTIGTHTVLWVAGVTAAPLIETLGLPTVKGRLTVGADLRVPGRPEVFAAGDAAAVPDLTRSGAVAPPTAQHAVRQAKVLGDNVLASLGHGSSRRYLHHDMGMVADLGPGKAIANPFDVELTGYPAKAVTRTQRLLSIPRAYNRCQAAFAYLTGAVFPRTLVSFGLSSGRDAPRSRSR